MIKTLVMTLLGMAAVGGVSLALYASLPADALALAERHGRFAGLGRRKVRVARASSRSRFVLETRRA